MPALINPVHDAAIAAVIYPDPDAPAMTATARQMALGLLPLNSPAELLEAQGLMGDIKEFRDALETRKQEVKAAPLELCRRIDDLVRPLFSDLDFALAAVKQRITDYARAQEAMRADAEAEARALEADGRTPEITPELIAAVAAPAVKVKQRTFTEYSIDDSTKIPVEFLTLNTVAVKAYVKLHGKAPPGIATTTEKRAV